ncbi:hypothetical protein DSL72_000989 [Monilinia vaccinii-corymbosi]|uniref:EVE domain-containing protein n=1 Tax=Monilinia vaccinii-corymbosi TaxID=61207 RepID=A0A8A3P598_9HELO|nr:hypothetical protein DSL72_000989 [Monilinia vaccinii-corymbosi]
MLKRKVGDDDVVPVEPRRSNRQKRNNKETTTSLQSSKKGNQKKATNGPVLNDIISSTTSTKSSQLNGAKSTSNSSSTRQYWLMKAEPESRMEKGHDIKFSIDDLAAKTEPEPWDGMLSLPHVFQVNINTNVFQRNTSIFRCVTLQFNDIVTTLTYILARNNLRAMKKGDLAFFYHSSCKIPAIVGIMEIVEEHSPDLSAHDPKAAYYDPKSSPDDPKWSVVHVKFRQKLKTPITLKEIKAWFEERGNALNNMQMLKLARLSVSKVSSEEWRFLVGEMKKNGDEIEE